MQIDELGLVKDNGASDWADSSRFAGLLALVDHPNAPDLRKYFVDGKPVRHPTATVYPENEPRVMSRDQLVVLAAGLAKQGFIQETINIANTCQYFAPNDMDEVTRKWKLPDIIAPHISAHFNRCAGRPVSMLSLALLKLDIYISGKFFPLAEQNQLQAVVLTAGKPFVEYYVKCNPQWEQATREYWYTGHGAWRNEQEVAEMLIAKIKSYLC